MTFAPMCFAIWVAAMPTPAGRVNQHRLVRLQSAHHDDELPGGQIVHGIDAPCSADMFDGRGKTCACGAQTTSA